MITLVIISLFYFILFAYLLSEFEDMGTKRKNSGLIPRVFLYKILYFVFLKFSSKVD